MFGDLPNEVLLQFDGSLSWLSRHWFQFAHFLLWQPFQFLFTQFDFALVLIDVGFRLLLQFGNLFLHLNELLSLG